MTQETVNAMHDADTPPAGQALRRVWRDPLAAIARFQSVIGLVLVLAGGIAFSPSRHGQLLFLAPHNIANIVRDISETGIITLVMTVVITTCGLDCSVGVPPQLGNVLAPT